MSKLEPWPLKRKFNAPFGNDAMPPPTSVVGTSKARRDAVINAPAAGLKLIASISSCNVVGWPAKPFTTTAMFEPLSVRPSIPWNPAVAAVPSSAVHTRVGSLDSDAIANAKSTPPSPRPRWFAVPEPVPANADASARESIRDAVAGLFDRVILIPEPFLAALGCRDEARLSDPGYIDPVRNSLFIDIGDPQDLSHSLSTFSGHVRRIGAALERLERLLPAYGGQPS